MSQKTKLKNDEKAKRKPNQNLWFLVGGAIILVLLALGAGFVGISRTTFQPDVMYTTNCGWILHDLDTDTTEDMVFDPCTIVLDYDLSPDGSQIVYTDNESNVFIANLYPYQVITALDKAIRASVVSWSPDGETIAMWNDADMPSGQALGFYDVASNEWTEHSVYSVRYPSIAWSPNSREVLFTTDHYDHTQIVHYDIVTEIVTPVTEDRFLYKEVIWDGQFAYAYQYDYDLFQKTLVQIDLLSGEKTQILAEHALEMTLSADGRFLTYTQVNDGGYPSVVVYDLQTGTERQVTPHEPVSYQPHWLPTADYAGIGD